LQTLSSGTSSILDGEADFHAKTLLATYINADWLADAPYAYHNYGFNTANMDTVETSTPFFYYTW